MTKHASTVWTREAPRPARADEPTRPRRGSSWPTIDGLWDSLAYVPAVARRYLGIGLDFDELVAAGNLGLVEAALRFDVSRGVKFITYADWWIRKAIVEAVEDQSGPVRTPRYHYERLRQLERARSGLTTLWGGEPTVEQLAAAAGLSREDVERLRRTAPSGVSLDQPVSRESERSIGDVLHDIRAETPQGSLLRRDLEAHLRARVAALERRERQVILLRFGFGGEPPVTLRTAGRLLGISRERVRQIELRALVKLRQNL